MKSNCNVTDINVIKILIHRFILYLHPFKLFCYLSLQSNNLSIYVWFSYINNCDCLYLQVPVLHYNFNTTFMLSIFFHLCFKVELHLKKSLCSERTELSWYICILIMFIAYKLLALWLLTPWITIFKSKALEENMNHASIAFQWISERLTGLCPKAHGCLSFKWVLGQTYCSCTNTEKSTTFFS